MGLAYLLVVVTLGASTVCGQALLRIVGGREWAWTAPASGYALLLCVAAAAIRLPGHGVTAAAALGIAVVASAALTRLRGLLRLLAAAPAVLAILCLASLPFISNARLGLLGVSVDNDLAPHLAWAEGLRVGNEGLTRTMIRGYPMGPHALAASLSDVFGTGVEVSLCALLLLTPVLAGVTAFGVLPRLSTPLRFVGSLAVAFPYLATAYFAEGAFKEPLLAMFVLAFVLVLRDICLRMAPWRETAVLGVIAGGAVNAYGFPALAPLVAATVLALLFLQVITRTKPELNTLRRAGQGTALGAGAAAVALLPQIDRIVAFSPVEAAVPDKTNPFGGNFVGDISGYEIFGLWPSSDFRFPPVNLFRAGELAALGALVAVYGAAWWIRRRDPFLPAAVAACLVIYAYVHRTDVAYISAKTLTITTMALAAMATFPLLAEAAERGRGLLRPVVYGAIGIAFVTGALWSTSRELVAAQVGPLNHANELRAINGVVSGHPTLFLGHDDFAPWELSGAEVTYPFEYAIGSRIPVEYRRDKPPTDGQFLDFDSVTPRSLDRFDFVVETHTAFASSAPTNWRKVRQYRWFTLWRRSGPTPARAILSQEGTAPGAVLSCTRRAAASLRNRIGVAGIRPAPLTLVPQNWGLASGGRPSPDEVGYASVPAGLTVVQKTAIPRGRWEVSLQYASPTSVSVTVGGTGATLPASLDRKGPFWHVTDLLGHGQTVAIRVMVKRAPALAPQRFAAIGAMALTRVDKRERVVRLSQACGRYVDWYSRRLR